MKREIGLLGRLAHVCASTEQRASAGQLASTGQRAIAGLCAIVWLCASTAFAATGTSEEFAIDLSGMGPWEVRTAKAGEAIAYSSEWATNALTDAQAVVKVWPVKRAKPKYIAIDLSGGTAATHYPIEYLDEIPGGSWSDEYKTSKLVLRHIPAGSFIMGGRNTDYPGAVNTNLHMVTLTRDFYMGVFEVTQRQWELVMGNRPSAFSNETCYATRPVEMVSYADIRGGVKGITWPESKDVDDGSFMGRVRSKSGLTGFDLPTEAQWEYACRAGSTTALSNGKNLSDMTNAVELAGVTRYAFNSGWAVDTYLTIADGRRWTEYNCTDEKGTAKVGSYPANPFGLYDMDGNVGEIVADVYESYRTACMNPVGPFSTTSNRRVYCGGCWRFPAWSSCSGNRHTGDFAYSSRAFSCGFRLCLQGGEIPETTEGVELVNAAGEGTATWTPTKTGLYYLTHETQTNGVNGAEVLGAWFEVAGPELTFTPDGDLVPGVKIAINGAGEGWTVRYEMVDAGQVSPATEPAAAPNLEYTGPITLNGSATIRAVAYSASGVSTEVFSETFSLLSVGSARARPRYPWNGKVDIDCELKGDAGRLYAVSLEARDLDGGTNLPVRSVNAAMYGRAPDQGGAADQGGESGLSIATSGADGAFLLAPGTYRFTWDADADIAGDGEFPNVAVSVSAAGGALTGAKRVLELTVAGYTGTETLADVPVLVRLSSAIEGFSYSDFADEQGGDLVFCDEGESVVYPHEIDEWHVGGESLVWVKLPEVKQGTKFKMGYGGHIWPPTEPAAAPDQAAAVWSDYAGVWHMNEDSGTAYDSTGHGLDGIPSCGTNTLADVSQMVAYENGACGRARVNANVELYGGNYMAVPSYDALQLKSKFVVSGWFFENGKNRAPRLISRKCLYEKYSGWESGWEFVRAVENGYQLYCRGAGETGFLADTVSVASDWYLVTLLYDNDSCSVYTNGVLSVAGTIVPATDNGLELGIGGVSGGNGYNSGNLNGQYDEIRLRGGSLSADRIKADYDMIANRAFLNYGAVTRGTGAAE